MGYNLAIVGATGAVGKEILSLLESRKFPLSKLNLLASERSMGREVNFMKKNIKVDNLENFNFRETDIAFFTAGSRVSEKYAEQAAQKRCLVIDNTSYFRMENDIPLIVPEVNINKVSMVTNRNIIANPNCSTIQMVVALKPIHDLFEIKRVVVSTYQSVSGAGASAMRELSVSSLNKFDVNPKDLFPEKVKFKIFPRDIAFNVIPHIDKFLEDGTTKEEMKMINETKKILDSRIKVSATCVRTPTYRGHAESVNVECLKEIDLDLLRKIFSSSSAIGLVDNPDKLQYITPKESDGKDEVFVSRLRLDQSQKNTLNMWVVSDNLRKGAALNSVQIAEELIKNNLINKQIK